MVEINFAFPDYGCQSCVHVLYHPRDKGCPCDGCLGTEEEIKANEGKYLYKHHVKGDGVKARLEAERRGDVNIVIGGSGEHEVNAKWLMSEAYEKLAHVCEEVGGVVTHKGNYRLELTKTYEPFYWHLEWMNGKFYRIMKVTEKEWWVDED
jgi:hypothetical protein